MNNIPSLDYEPDMKDPRDFTYRLHDWSLDLNGLIENEIININNHPPKNINNDNYDLSNITQSSEYLEGIIGLLQYYIKNQSEETKKIYEQITQQQFYNIKKNCRQRHASLTFRSIFTFLRTFIQAATIETGTTELIYWRVPHTILQKTLEEVPVFTGIPIFRDCLQKSVGNIYWELNIPSRENHFLGYLPILLYKSTEDDMYSGIFIFNKNVNIIHVPKFLIHVCEPIFWVMQIKYNEFEKSMKKNKQKVENENKPKNEISNITPNKNINQYSYSFNTYEYYMKIGGSI
jgi:hypothetical protein